MKLFLKQVFASVLVLGGFYGVMMAEKRLAEGQQIIASSNEIAYLSDQFTTFGGYAAPLNTMFIISAMLNMPVASLADFGLVSTGSGGAGNSTGVGFANDDGKIGMNLGTAGAGAWRSLAVQINTATVRTLVLGTTPQRFSFRMNTSGGLTQKTVVAGLLDSSTIDTTFNAAGAGDAVMFRLQAVGAAVNWFAVTKNGASETTTDTGQVDTADAEYTFEIIATSAQIIYKFCVTLNCTPVVVATHTTNIPNDALGPTIGGVNADAVNKFVQASWWKYITIRLV